jgi:hypothetical protein
MFLFEHDLRANAFRVCREGKPVPTFPDHALERAVASLSRSTVAEDGESRQQEEPPGQNYPAIDALRARHLQKRKCTDDADGEVRNSEEQSFVRNDSAHGCLRAWFAQLIALFVAGLAAMVHSSGAPEQMRGFGNAHWSRFAFTRKPR